MLRPVLLSTAVLLAIGAGVLAKQHISATEQRLEKAAVPVTVDVLVLMTDLEIGQTVSAGNLGWQTWPAEAVHRAYLTRDQHPDAVSRLTGAAARQPLFNGEPVTNKKLVKRDHGGVLSVVIDDGFRAITMKVDEAQGLAGLVMPGDRVDVILTHRIKSTSSDTGSSHELGVAETIVRDVRVLGVGQEIRGEEDPKKPAKSITLEVGPSDAEAISLGRSLGTLSLALRSSFSEQPERLRRRAFTREQDVSGAVPGAAPDEGNLVIYRGTRRTGS